MTAENKSTNRFWGSLGKAGMLIGLIWGGIQIFSYVFKLDEYEVKVQGKHSFYKTAPILLDGYENSIKYKAIVKTVIESDGSLKNYQLDTLFSEISNNFKYYTYDVNFRSYYPVKDFSWDGDYNSAWEFKITNTGNKPLEELALELPFSGYYAVSFPNDVIKSGFFSNKINLGELRPSYEINIICWSSANYSYPEGDEEKSRFTHKNGWFRIEYPLQASTLDAWNQRNHNLPFLILIFMITFIVIILKSFKSSNVNNNQVKIQDAYLESEENNSSQGITKE